MPDVVATFLIRFQNEIWMAFLGLVGGSVRVAIGMSNGEKMPPALVFATLTSGAVLAGTSGQLFSSWLGLGTAASNFCSFIVGVIGMKVVVKVMEMDISPMLSQLFSTKREGE